MGYRTWVYHETEEPKIVDSEDAQELYDNGWKDSPRYFVKTTDFGVDPDDEIKVQQLGEAIEGIAESLNGALNLQEMSVKELKAYAEKHYGKKLKAVVKPKMVEEIEALIDG